MVRFCWFSRKVCILDLFWAMVHNLLPIPIGGHLLQLLHKLIYHRMDSIPMWHPVLWLHILSKRNTCLENLLGHQQGLTL
uniref:Putative secreted protein n=1 Tax=Panstrongylus lignarius TaxID=156445 RepID=A0A224XWN3_9HEMI